MPARRRRIARVVACVFATIILLARVAPAQAQTTQPVRAVVRIGMTVDDLDRSERFFTDVLDFHRDSALRDDVNHTRIVDLKLGDETLELTDYLDPGGRAIPPDLRSNDRWFQHIAIVTTDMDAAYQRLQAHHVRSVSLSPQRLPDWNPNAGGIRAFYFKDPDDHVLELINFPPGKGNPKWQQAKSLFVGIDHTAIVVADTDASLAFYRDRLGLKIAGRSDNYGIEQERLNNVVGAHLRITSLRAAEGPGIEFLEYLTPRDGRPFPADSRPNDLFHWQTTLLVPGLSAASLVRDPDGHAMLLTPKE